MKLRAKLILFFVGVALLAGTLIVSLTWVAVGKIVTQKVAELGLSEANELAESTKPGLKAGSEAVLLPLLQRVQASTGATYVMALDARGTVLGHTNVAQKGLRYTDAMSVAMSEAEKPQTRISRENSEPIMNVSVPVWNSDSDTGEQFMFGGETPRDKSRLGTIRLGLPLTETLQTQKKIVRQLLLIVLSIEAAAFVVGLVLMRKVLTPILLLSEGTKRISEGDYCVIVPVSSRDELGDLAANFNRMSRILSETTVSKNYLGDILSNMVDPLLVMGPAGTIRMVNQAAQDLLGYTENELRDQNAQQFFIFNDRWIKGAVRNVEMEMIAKSGAKIPVLFSSSHLIDRAGHVTGIIAVAKDMTERKRLEGAIRQSEKMSAVGQLAAGVAHEINNPLAVILGFAHSLVGRLRVDDPLEMPLKSIEREANRCKNLVQDLLTFSRVSKIDREPIDLNTAVEGALSLINAQARLANVEVRKELATGLPHLMGNLNQIQQIIINLANNALDAMGGKGLLTVKTDGLVEGPLSWACLRVIDTGPGIPADIQSRIFDPFFTTKAVGKGTGLGLSLVHEIIKKHSGSIDLESRPGHTEFCVKFPIRLMDLVTRDSASQ